MKERPIIFKAEMVRAILEGRKTQTRRVVKFGKHPNGSTNNHAPLCACPHGIPGDRLWVREATWECVDNNDRLHYVADGPSPESGRRHYKKRPSIYMPRACSRIDLEITGVRVERLNDISEEDALREGAYEYWGGLPDDEACHICSHKAAFAHLWESINGPGSWDKNPWVWVIEFEQPNIATKGDSDE